MGVNKHASQKEGYGHFLTEEGDDEYGSFEVFYLDIDLRDEWNRESLEVTRGYQDPYTCGWYWWSCFPGCLPDGDPLGPFNTSTLAWKDARGL